MSRLEAIASRLEAIASRLEAIAGRLEAVATGGGGSLKSFVYSSCWMHFGLVGGCRTWLAKGLH